MVDKITIYLESELVNKFIAAPFTITQLKGGMSSNKCFKIDSQNDSYTLIVFRDDKKSEENITAWHDVTLKLKDFYPIVRYPIVNKLEKFTIDNQKYSAGFYKYIDGQTIPWSGYNSKEIFELGQIMKRLHDELSCVKSTLPKWDEMIIQELEYFLSYINFVGVYVKEKIGIEINQEKLAEHIKKIIDFSQTKKDNTVLHYDLQRANLIFKDNKLHGIIDFEKACVGPRIADISKTCAYLLHDRKWHSAKYIKYHFLRGYGDVPNLDMFDTLITHHFFIEMKNWLYNTPFEDLKNNKVFNKVTQFLIQENYVKQSF